MLYSMLDMLYEPSPTTRPISNPLILSAGRELFFSLYRITQAKIIQTKFDDLMPLAFQQGQDPLHSSGLGISSFSRKLASEI